MFGKKTDTIIKGLAIIAVLMTVLMTGLILARSSSSETQTDCVKRNLEPAGKDDDSARNVKCWERKATAPRDLRNAVLFKAYFTSANLTNLNLTNANLIQAWMSYSDLTNSNLSNADLTKAKLRDAKFERTNMTGANLTEAELINADLRFADLTGAILKDANLTGAMVSKSSTKGVDFEKWTRRGGIVLD